MKMKHGLILGLFLAATVPLFGVANESDNTDTGAEKANASLSFAPIGTAVVKGDNVNVRGLPSFTGEVVTRLKKGETVTLLEEITLKKPRKDEPTNWFRISLPTNTLVWVHADFVADATVAPKKLNVRAGPGENYSVVARLQKGDTVKVLRKVEDWVEIEAPTNAFAFVAADLLEKAPTPPPAPAPAPVPALPAPVPAPEVVTLPPAEPPVPAVTEPAKPEPLPAPELPPQIVVSTPEPEQTPEVTPKRIIKREGIVRKARNIQAPTHFELEGLDGRVINYLQSVQVEKTDSTGEFKWKEPMHDLREYVGRRVVLTGEEFIDKRWKATPVLEFETIDLKQ